MMALELVNKRDLSLAASLAPEEQHAIRAVAGGTESEILEARVFDVMKRARANRLWLGCDCRGGAGKRPVVAPCRNYRGTEYWRVLTGRQLSHDPECVFHRAHMRGRNKGQRSRPPRTPPQGYFAVLEDEIDDDRVSKQGGGSGGDGDGVTHRRAALSQRLLMLLDRAKLNRVRPSDEPMDDSRLIGLLQTCTAAFEIAPGRPLTDLWFPRARMWNGQWVHARIREAARDWPAGHKPQGFLCWVVWDVDARGVGKPEENNRVEVVSRFGRPIVGRRPVGPPYLFLGVVGLPQGQRGYECLEAFAQPIVAKKWAVPVDSRYERQAFGTLRKGTLQVLSKDFPDIRFELEKPVFDIATPDGPCLPDFLIRARRGREELTFVIEVMGFDRPEYLERKEVTHARMERLGTLCTMRASEFAHGHEGVQNEGRKVTNTIRGVLQGRTRRRNTGVKN